MWYNMYVNIILYITRQSIAIVKKCLFHKDRNINLSKTRLKYRIMYLRLEYNEVALYNIHM